MEQNSPCPLFAKTHCPDMKKICQFHHNTQTCSQGRACESQSCDLHHPPDCQLFAQGWCGYLDKEALPRRYKSCSYFHPQNIPQIPPTSVVN